MRSSPPRPFPGDVLPCRRAKGLRGECGMDAYLQVIVLGIVQGIAEFLPISSSGHLVIAKQMFGQTLAAGKDLEVMLHLGTLVAILVVYARELWDLRKDFRLCAVIVLATIPAAVVGLTLEDWFDKVFSSPLVAGFGLLITAALLLTGHLMETGKYTEKTLPWPAMLLIGCFQAVALLPGISRSGSTIVGGLLTGMDRVSATRFSFLLAIPVMGGAILITLKHLVDGDHASIPVGPLVVGIVVSFVVGWLVLKGMIRLVQQRKLPWFAAYCAAAGLLTITLSLMSSSTVSTIAVSNQPSTAGVSR